MEKLVLIDGHSILNRAFYGMPDLTNSAGRHTGAVYGFLNILFSILEEEQAQYLTVVFDVNAKTFRHKAYPDYKGTRNPMPEELREQVPLMKQVLHAMNIATCEKEGYEADDLLGTLAKKAQESGMEVTLVSGDRDLLQIADEHILIRIPKTKGGRTVIENYHAAEVKEALGVTPKEFIQVKALQGDSSDNVPGVPKVGPKTATDLIRQYHSVDGVYEHLSEIKRKALHDTLAANEEQARMSLFLVTIRTDAEVALDRETAAITNFYTPEAFRIFTELGFRNYLSRFDSLPQEEQEKSADERDWEVIEEKASVRCAFEEIARLLQSADPPAGEEKAWFGVYPVYDHGGKGLPARLLGLALDTQEKTYWFDCVSADGAADRNPAGAAAEPAASEGAEQECDFRKCVTEELGALRHMRAQLAVFDLKGQYPYWEITENEFDSGGIRLDGLFDVLLAAYLLNPLKSDYEPEDVASEYLGETIEGKKTFLGKETFAQRMMAEHRSDGEQREEKLSVASFAVRNARMLAKAAPILRDRLREQEMWDLYQKVELPLSYILYDMQRIGIRVRPRELREYGDQLVGRIEELETSIYQQAGHEFNIASPKQLGTVLFDEMHLPNGRKTKSGYSTAADVLEKLAPDYPIAADILEYRTLTKLKSTYADGLSAYIAEDSRIHTTFNQTITATGRISSTEPNLQNIPMRTELGRAIRKVFLPSEGWLFTDADYSQIELRILASMSGDEALIEAYRENRDIHAATASRVFHTPYNEVTDLQRRNAKAVNFGIVYGISSFGLSQNLSITRGQAQEYIESYFAMFPGVKRFLDEEVSSAMEKGYSVTLFGRRRPIPELKNSNYMQRQFGERVAMNAPIQGTGADIMKIAMIRVWEALHRQRLKSRLILQIHDELLIETAPGEEEAVARILREGMMGAAHLRVPLEIDCHTGTDWYSAK